MCKVYPIGSSKLQPVTTIFLDSIHAGRRPSSFVPSTLASSRVASAADLVGGLRRLSARLLKPPLQEQEEVWAQPGGAMGGLQIFGS